MENLARYIIRASFSQERMTYVPEAESVIYQSKDGQTICVFDALVWLAVMTNHIPNKGKQMVRNYGYYSKVSRGKCKKTSSCQFETEYFYEAGGILNFNGLSSILGISAQTVKNYAAYSEKTFIIRKVTPYFRNLRKEISKSPVIYFNDIGMRNFAIRQFGRHAMFSGMGFILLMDAHSQ